MLKIKFLGSELPHISNFKTEKRSWHSRENQRVRCKKKTFENWLRVSGSQLNVSECHLKNDLIIIKSTEIIETENHWRNRYWILQIDLRNKRHNLIKLYGYKWFTSAITSDMTLTLARIHDHNGEVTSGTKGLSLFYVKLRIIFILILFLDFN